MRSTMVRRKASLVTKCWQNLKSHALNPVS